MTIRSQEQLWQIINTFPEKFQFQYSLLLCSPLHLFDARSQEMIHRHDYCVTHPSVPPFPGSYEELPAFWLDAERIIEQELPRAFKHKQKTRKT